MNILTTRQVAEQLGTSPKVVLENARKCLCGKIIQNGKPTYWTPEEVTIIIERMKQSKPNQNGFTASVKGVSTELTPALKIKKALELMQEGYEEEMERLRTVNQTLVQENMKLEDEKAALLPRAEAYSQFLDRSQSINLRDAAQYLGVTQTELMSVLKARYIYRAKDGYRAYSEYSCYFMLRPWTNGDRSGQQLLMTSKGLDFFRGRLPQKIEDRTGGQDAE